MKRSRTLTFVLVAIMTQATSLGIFLWWYYSTGYDAASPTIVVWPAIALSRSGVAYSGLIWLGIIITLISTLVWGSCGSWIRIAIVNMLGIGLYCASGWWFIMRLSVPLPRTTPFDGNPAERAIYLKKFDEGFRSGMLCRFNTYCFAPQDEEFGFLDGQNAGLEVWYRVLGEKSPFKGRKGMTER